MSDCAIDINYKIVLQHKSKHTHTLNMTLLLFIITTSAQQMPLEVGGLWT